MACRFIFQGKEYTQDSLVQALREMPLDLASKHIPGIQHVPNAPFKQSWPDLGLRRAIVKAVHEGKDAISWTPGAKQAERFSLSKQLSRVEYNQKHGDLTAYDKSNNPVMVHGGVSEEKLADYIGKEASERILKNPSYHEGNLRALSGLDLEVGGEGMKAFYDKMLVDKANAIGKKYGAKVEWKEIPGARNSNDNFDIRPSLEGGWLIADIKTNARIPGSPNFINGRQAEKWLKDNNYLSTKVPVLRLTPELKKHALEHGLPLFANQAGKTGAAASALAEGRSPEDKRIPGPPAQEDNAHEPAVQERAAGGRVLASEIDPNPTEAQKEAGNYAKSHVSVLGMDIAIENAKGSKRSGVGRDGRRWSCFLPAHYGYVKKTTGADGDHVDVYLGPHRSSPHAFVIDQIDRETGKFDEHKALVGFGSLGQALNVYRKAFSDGKANERIGAVTTLTVPQLKTWLREGNTHKPLANLPKKAFAQ